MGVGWLLTATPDVEIETGNNAEGSSRPSAGAAADYVGIVTRFVAIGLVVVVVSACTASADDSGFGCQPTPEAQRHSEGEFPLSVSENPTVAGDVVTLYVGSNETPGPDKLVGEALTGYGSSWQCWNGTEWVNTHQLVHGAAGPGETIEGEPGVTTTAPAIGILVPFPFEITVPAVEPGWYRIETGIIADMDDGSRGTLVGHIAVEVNGNE